MTCGVCTPATHHIERHDDHEVDADAGAGGGKLPVLLDKVPVEGGELLHGDEPKNHHGKHGRQDQRNLSRREEGEGERGWCRGGGRVEDERSVGLACRLVWD